MRVPRSLPALFPLFRALEEESPRVNRAYISVSPCLREKFGEENVLYALALPSPGRALEGRGNLRYFERAMNDKTLRLLEFDAVRGRVADCARSAEAAALILADLPRIGAAEAGELKALTGEILDRMRERTGEPVETLPETGFLFPRLETAGAALETDELFALGLFVSRAGNLLRWLKTGSGEWGVGSREGGKSPPPLQPAARSYAPPLSGGAPPPATPPGPFPQALHAPLKLRAPHSPLPTPHTLQTLIAALPDCSAAEREIFRVLDREGRLRDLPEFRGIRERIRRLGRDLESLGSRYAAGEETRHMLQSSLPSQRDGRLVLAVKANFRGRIRGIVHEVSASGQTVFVEPEEAVEINNELLIEERRLDGEIRRVLRELTARIAEFREDLAALHRGIVYIETIRARARYGFETRGVFAREAPAQGPLALKKARHPLLGSKAVPLDLETGPGVRTVIITGPNTGGKTVALKTLGLLALMNQFGLPLPAEEGTALPVFDGVYADIGDEQSLSQSLSTFSAHMTNIAAIMGAATENSLVLLDELGSGTDPEEGCAIAMAILDRMIETSVRSLITTHQGILKNYGYTRQGVENASMEFDGQTLSPTFRIIMGIPGESRALEIAGRNGLPPELVERARHYLADERSDVSALIAGLKEKRRELEEAAAGAEAEELRLREERRKADLKELRLRQQELLIKQDGAGSLRRLLGESRKTLENLVREVREGELTREKTLKVKDFLNSLAASAAAEEAGLEREEAALAEDRRRIEEEAGETAGLPAGRGGKDRERPALGPGQPVLAGEGKRRGTIVRADKKGFWVVEVGSIRMTLAEGELVPLRIGGEELRPAASLVELAAPATASFELKLLGQRTEEALENLRRQIDGAILSGLREFSVVHGKGDGILQRAVHGYLKTRPEVADYYFSRPELGGFGRTEVILRG